MSSTATPPTDNILVVDDTPANLQLLTSMLKGRGYRVRPVSSGETALRAVEAQLPDLILLDISMPGMDGYEVCRRLKADARWSDIPVLFISALHDTEVKVRAFRAGGIDYVGKPFQFEEIDARVRTHLALRRQQLKLRESYTRLQDEERLRDNLTHMIAHDMRSPLLALQVALELLQGDIPAQSPDASLLMSTARRSVAQLVEMISQMLDVSRMQGGKMQLHVQPADLVAITREELASLQPLAGKRKVEFNAPSSAWGSYDPDILRRVVGNLIGNALKYTPATGCIDLTIEETSDAIRFAVHDNGVGIPLEFHQTVFEKFGQVNAGANRIGSGLGLTFAKMAVEAHGGRIGLVSAPGQGSTFWFMLPKSAGGHAAVAEIPAPSVAG